MRPDERCAKHTECADDEYEVEAPSRSLDRTCKKLTDCLANNQYIHTFSKPNLNRVCASCDATQWLDTSNPGRIKTLPPGHPDYGNSTSEGAYCKPEFTYEGKLYRNTCVARRGKKPLCVTENSTSLETKFGICDERVARCKTPTKCDPTKKQYQTKALTVTSDRECGQCENDEWLNRFTNKCKKYITCNGFDGFFSKNGEFPPNAQRHCTKCPDGQYRSGNECKSYTVCPAGHVIADRGNETTDHECTECPSGTYEKNGVCKRHTVCEKGKRKIVRPVALWIARASRVTKAFSRRTGCAQHTGRVDRMKYKSRRERA